MEEMGTCEVGPEDARNSAARMIQRETKCDYLDEGGSCVSEDVCSDVPLEALCRRAYDQQRVHKTKVQRIKTWCKGV